MTHVKVTFAVSENQLAILHEAVKRAKDLQEHESQSDMIRSLLADKVRLYGLSWPNDLAPWGYIPTREEIEKMSSQDKSK